MGVPDDSDEAHRFRCCDVVRCVTQAIMATQSIIVDESPTPNGDTATAKELEQYFLSHTPSNRLKVLTRTIGLKEKEVMCSYVRHRTSGVTIATRRSGGLEWDRIYTPIVGPMESFDILDEEASEDSCLLEIH